MSDTKPATDEHELERHLEQEANDTGAVMKARAPLAVRIVLILCAVVLLAVAVIAAINLSTAHAYNEATQTLQSNIHEAAADDANLKELRTSQQQVDLEFDGANAMHTVLLPTLRDSIDTNTRVSRELTTMIDKALNNSDSNNDQSAGATGRSSLSDEQRQQIEQLLQSNGVTDSPSQSATSSDHATSDDGATTSTSQSTAKPW